MCQECGKKVLEILEQMERGGEFDGLNDDDREVERQIMGLRLRSGIKCPKEKSWPKEIKHTGK